MVVAADTLSAQQREEQLVVFTLQGESYGVSIESVNTIIRVPEITFVPRTVAALKGVMNLRGMIVPVISLRTRFGLPDCEATKEARVVVVDNHGTLIGMIVDAVTETMSLPASQIEPIPPIIMSVDSRYLRSVGKHGERLIILLELEKVLQRDEDEALRTL